MNETEKNIEPIKENDQSLNENWVYIPETGKYLKCR